MPLNSNAPSTKPSIKRGNEVLLSLLLTVPAALISMLVYGLGAWVILGDDGKAENIFQSGQYIFLIVGTLSFALSPIAIAISRISGNKSVSLVIVFTLAASIISFFGLGITEGLVENRKTSKQIEKAKSSFQLYEPSYLPSGARERDRFAEPGYFGLNYSLQNEIFEIMQAPNPDSSTFFGYRCAKKLVEIKFCDNYSWEEIKVKNYQGYYLTHPKSKVKPDASLVWKANGTYLMIETVVAPLSKEEFIIIAESMVPLD